MNQDHHPAGVVVGLLRDGAREWAAGGVLGSSGSRMTAETMFDLASVTKAFTTSALQRLVAEGLVRYDDPVARYVPTTGCAPGTTLRSLLLHRAGLWEWQPLYLAGGDPWEALDGLALRYEPGTARHYSDLGFMLLGRVIEQVAGTGLDQAMAELLFRPFGLTRTKYGPVADQVAASGWGDSVERHMVATGEPYPILFDKPDFAWREGELVGEVNDGNAFHAFGGVAGHAGLFSNVPDLLALAGFLARGSGGFWGDTRELYADGPDAGQALGWRSLPVSLRRPGPAAANPRTRLGAAPISTTRMLWHPGYTGCAIGFVPGTGVGVVMLTNRLTAGTGPMPTPLDTEAMWGIVLAELGLTAVGGSEGTP